MASQNPQFVRQQAPGEYEVLTFKKDILYDKSLSGNALKLLLLMLDFGRRPGWSLRQTHLISLSGFGYRSYNTAIENLEKSGYVMRMRGKEKGRHLPYEYRFSQSPIFLQKGEETAPENTPDPHCVLQTGECKLQNASYTSSYNYTLDKRTTNPEGQKVPKKPKNLVGSFFEKLPELEELPRIDEGQKATLYSKYSHEQILQGIKAINLETADSVFASLITAIKKGWVSKSRADCPNRKNSLIVASVADKYLMSEHGIKVGANTCIVKSDNTVEVFVDNTIVGSLNLNDENFAEKLCSKIKGLREFIQSKVLRRS